MLSLSDRHLITTSERETIMVDSTTLTVMGINLISFASSSYAYKTEPAKALHVLHVGCWYEVEERYAINEALTYRSRLLIDNRPIYDEDATQRNDICDVSNEIVALNQMYNAFVLPNVVILKPISSTQDRTILPPTQPTHHMPKSQLLTRRFVPDGCTIDTSSFTKLQYYYVD
ncbi:hypothetical protein PILCRDRAFT_3669 [Piloderma croceum F 1598]|uniref:Uncharacterized protein n=1 Tax=Piloderma croceum (strain F 1598) TaxID=765440 RepID=A0A0C3FUA1_PILCF|nr:hypothetical protein PILCRDRAFT_3669 [Piloderma croceum F 1598]